jgi:hypothetical protein
MAVHGFGFHRATVQIDPVASCILQSGMEGRTQAPAPAGLAASHPVRIERVTEATPELVDTIARLLAAAVGFVNELNDLGARILFHGGEFLSVFDKTQLDALGMLFIRLNGQGIMIAEIFWGLWLFPFGLLVFRSGFLPRFIGVWLMINCFGYLVLSMTALFFPAYNDKLFLYLQPVFFGELAIMLYLLIKGAKVPTVAAAAA